GNKCGNIRLSYSNSCRTLNCKASGSRSESTLSRYAEDAIICRIEFGLRSYVYIFSANQSQSWSSTDTVVSIGNLIYSCRWSIWSNGDIPFRGTIYRCGRQSSRFQTYRDLSSRTDHNRGTNRCVWNGRICISNIQKFAGSTKHC